MKSDACAMINTGFQTANRSAAFTNQKVSINISHEKSLEWPPCFFSHREMRMYQRSEGLVDSEQNLQNRQWHTLTGDERYQLQSNESNYILVKAGTRLKSSCVPLWLSHGQMLYFGK